MSAGITGLSRRCGDGDYETTATGHHKINGVWQGGAIDSGIHYLD